MVTNHSLSNTDEETEGRGGAGGEGTSVVGSRKGVKWGRRICHRKYRIHWIFFKMRYYKKCASKCKSKTKLKTKMHNFQHKKSLNLLQFSLFGLDISFTAVNLEKYILKKSSADHALCNKTFQTLFYYTNRSTLVM